MPPEPLRYPYEQIAEDLKRRIESGDLKPGDRMPSRTQLTERWNVSRPTVDRAMTILKLLGYTESLPGMGVYVKRTEQSTHDTGRPDVLRRDSPRRNPQAGRDTGKPRETPKPDPRRTDSKRPDPRRK